MGCNNFGKNESVTIHLDPEKFLPKPSWMPMAGTETLLLNSLALPPAWLDMLNLLIFFFLPLKLKRRQSETIKYILQWHLLIDERLFQQFSCSCSFLGIRNEALEKEILGNLRHLRRDFRMNFVETNFEHCSLRCTLTTRKCVGTSFGSHKGMIKFDKL